MITAAQQLANRAAEDYVDPEQMLALDDKGRSILRLSHLKVLPSGCTPTLSTSGTLDLNHLESLPEGAKLTAGHILWLDRLWQLPKHGELKSGSHMFLTKIMSLEPTCKLSVGGDLHLGRIWVIQKWFDRRCVKGKIYGTFQNGDVEIK